MSLPLPNLDDRTFDDLVAEGIRLIPGLAPSWTDHNPSDPGITLIELFAFVAEMLMYRADRISDASRIAFVRLLRGEPEWIPKKALEEEIKDAVLALQREERAVTAADFERLALGITGVARARCLPATDVTVSPRPDAPAHVSVVVVPTPSATLQESAELIRLVQKNLARRCLLATRLHVARPRYLRVRLRLRVRAFADQSESAVRERIEGMLQKYLHPLRWPFGQPLYVSDLYATVDAVDGVDYVLPPVEDPEVRAPDAPKRALVEGTRTIGIQLEPNELPQLIPFSDAPPAADESWIEVEREPETVPEK